ncbi:outer membrane lipoprotein carrier protein LolA [Bacillus sp. JCM 19041]|uniref:LolA family protein n=1 Tax=Bacillus sp. JCM 19041 TaxID=1460637 RepID=UPI0006CF8094
MTKAKVWLSVFTVMMVLVLAACGEKSQEDVMNDVEEALETTNGYKSTATMKLETGQEPQTYDVEVWQKDNSYYKVDLKNTANDQSQIILKNEEGVFVLTPALNKTFRFQSDWPKTSSQAYLYESLLRDISLDADVNFAQDDNHYVFKTATTYQNKNLNSQEIRLNKKDLSPASVKIMDADNNVLVDVAFTEFEKNPSLAVEDFDTEKAMTGAQMSEPTMATSEEMDNVKVLYPMSIPEGIEGDVQPTIVENGDRKTYVQQYSGEKSFTLIQENSLTVPTSANPLNLIKGQPIDLGFTIGFQSSDRIMWSYEGSDFSLISQDFAEDEMAEIARSVTGVTEK